MRTRIWNGSTNKESLLNTAYYLNSGNVRYTWYSDWSDVWTKEMSDVVTPNYKQLSAMGVIVNNPMSSTEIKETCEPGYHDAQNTANDIRYEGWLYPSISGFGGYLDCPVAGDVDSLTSQGISKCWGNVTNAEAAALVTVAEGQKSINGIVDIFKRLIKIIRLVKKLRFKQLAKEISPSELADRWLEVRYGIRPLVYDAQQIIDALNQESLELGDRHTFRYYQAEKSDDIDTVESYDASTYTTQCHRFSTHEIEVRNGILCSLARVDRLDTWGVFDLPQAAWDLTHFSFVVDWFFNVGDVIASFSPSASWKALASWSMVTQTWTQEVSDIRTIWVQAGSSGGFNGGGRKKTVKTKVRTPDPSRPLVPSLGVNLNAFKLIDLVALARGLFTSIPKSRLRV